MKVRNSKRRLTAVIVATAILFLSLSVLLIAYVSGAWLFDDSEENKVTVDYSVAKLGFDLASDQMYYYYKPTDPAYFGGETPSSVFYTMVAALKSATDSFLVQPDKTVYTAAVLTALRTFYPAEMIGELDALYTAYTDGSQSAEEYGTGAEAIYNRYTARVRCPFKIRGFDLEAVDPDKGIWYYVAEDILRLYSQRFTVQDDASETTSATVSLGVKLPGGTTYNSDPDGAYYDPLFSSMVVPMTLELVNTGNMPFYFYAASAFPGADTTPKLGENGIAMLILPRDYDLDSLNATDNPAYYTDGNLDYRKLIAALLTAQCGSSGVDLPFYDENGGDLTALLTAFNAYALATYQPTPDGAGGYEEEGVSYNGNWSLAPHSTYGFRVLLWADYGTCADYYAAGHGGADFATSDAYQLIRADFTVHVRASFKDYAQMASTDQFDPGKQYNKEENYEKFAGVSNFDVDGYAFFLQDDGHEVNAKTHMDGGAIVCNYADATAENYIGRLRFYVRYRGFSPAYIRVKVFQQFTNAEGQIEGVKQISFRKGADWVDNRAGDLCYYSPVQYASTDRDVLTTSGRAKLLTIPLITGLNGTGTEIDPALEDNDNFTLKLSFYIEAVQPNRYQELWNITEIPTTDAGYETN